MGKQLKTKVKTAEKHVAKDVSPMTRTGDTPTKTYDIRTAKSSLSGVLSKTLDWITDYLVLHPEEILITKANLEQGMHADQVVALKHVNKKDDESQAMPDEWHENM